MSLCFRDSHPCTSLYTIRLVLLFVTAVDVNLCNKVVDCFSDIHCRTANNRQYICTYIFAGTAIVTCIVMTSTVVSYTMMMMSTVVDIL